MRGRLMKVSKNIKFFINYFLGPVLFVWLAWSVYRQIMAQPDLGKAWQHVRQSFNSPLIWNLVIVVLLMFVNWAIEAVKWKISVKEVQEVNFAKAFMAVLSGVSFAVSTPNRVGEYLGRVLYMKEGNRLKTISITITGSISQLIITLFIGCIGLYVLRPAIIEQHLISSLWMQVIFYGVLATAIVLTVFYFRLSWLVKWIEKIPGSRRFVYLVEAIEHFDATLLIRLLSLSLLRFIVFIIQY